MTFVGKILVLLNMGLSLVFLGFTTVAFTTSANWKDETEKQKKQVTALTAKVKTAEADKAAFQGQLTQAKANFDAGSLELSNQLAGVKKDYDQSQKDLSDARTTLTDAQTNAGLATAESQARTADLALVRDQLSASLKQSNDYKIQQTELNTQILTLQRSLAVAERNAKQLRETSWKFAQKLADHGISADISRSTANAPPPAEVEGKVLKVDAQNTAMEISLGSNDGLAEGQTLQLYRTDPPEYLGQVRVRATEPNQAVVVVIGRTINGKRIKEGDNVASTIRSN